MTPIKHVAAITVASLLLAAAPAASIAQAPSDPSQVAQHGWCYGNYVWNGTAGRIYHPTNSTCSTAIYSPLVVLLRGNGFSHVDYHYLLRHLARNGYIAVSVDVVSAQDDSPAAHQAAADKAWAFVYDFVWSTWSKRFFINPNAVGLVGHSRGGETVRYLADALADDPVFDVRAVVGLAPTGDTDLFLTGRETIGTMLLYGSADADVLGDQVFRHYDGAGNEDSQLNPVFEPDVVYKSMKFLYGGNHPCFADTGAPAGCNQPAQRELTEGYVLAFLAGHLRNDVTWYEDYIRGDAVPFGWSDVVVSQHSDGFLRRVIDHFDDGNVTPSTIGGGVYSSSLSLNALDMAPLASTPHAARVLSAGVQSPGAWIGWWIPPGKRDASLYEWLSLRIGQTAGEPAAELYAALFNGPSLSPFVRLTDHGTIPQPRTMCVQGTGTGLCQRFDEQSHLGTIRVPLSAFGAHDDVRFVFLYFGRDTQTRRFALDNVEFSEFILKP